MKVQAPFRLPAWRDGQYWNYELVRSGKQGFAGQLRYTASLLPDGAWRIEGRSDYPDGRSLHEWIEIEGDPARHRAAYFERRNATGLHRYESRQDADGALWLRVETDGGVREEQHPARTPPIYIGNQLDFLMHGLTLDAADRWRIMVRVESGKVLPFEIVVAERNARLPVFDEALDAVLITVKVATNPLVRMLAPPVRYWFHPKDQTMLVRIDHADSVLTLVEAG